MSLPFSDHPLDEGIKNGRIDVSDLDEIYVEYEGYVHVEGVE